MRTRARRRSVNGARAAGQAAGRAGHAGTTDARSSGGGQVGEKPWAVLRVAEDHLPLHTVRPWRSARSAVQHELLRGSGPEFAKPVCFSDEAVVRVEEECGAVVVGSGVQLGQVFKARCGMRLPGTAIVAEPSIGPVSRLHQGRPRWAHSGAPFDGGGALRHSARSGFRPS